MVKELNLDVKVVDVAQGHPPDFISSFPVRKIPAFVAADGFEIHELIAVVYYLTQLGGSPNALFGAGAKQHAEVLKWISFSNMDFWNVFVPSILPFMDSSYPYDQKAYDASIEESKVYVDVFETHLAKHKYLVGNGPTVADYQCASVVDWCFQTVWGKEFIDSHPAIYKWFNTIVSLDSMKELIPSPYKFLDKPRVYGA